MAAINLDIGGNTRRLDKDIQKTVNRTYAINLRTKGDQPLGRITGQVNEFSKSLDASNARVIAFGASAGIIFGLERAFTALVSSTIEVQKSLQDINVILNVSTQQLNKFGGQLFNIAKNTGQSFQEVAKAATEFSRQGLGVEETLKRTNEALILSRLSGLDAAKSVEALTAAVNSYASQAVTATEVVNKFATVDAAFAVSSADLAEALSRVGSSAAQSGVSLNELIAIVTSAQQTTARGGAVIGNSFKTIFTRLQRGRVVDLLGTLGISETDSSGQLKSTIQLLQDLGKVYDTLGARQQAAVAEQVGGVFQINILKAALADLGKEYSIYNSALNIASGATDQAIRRNEELNKTYAAQINALQENARQLAAAGGERLLGPSIDRLVGGTNALLSGFNESDGQNVGTILGKGILDGIGQFIAGPGIALIGGILLKLFRDLAKFATGSVQQLLGLNTAASQQRDLQASIQQILSKNPQLLELALKGEQGLNQAANSLLASLQKQTVELQKQAQVAAQISKAFIAQAGVRVTGGVPVVPTGRPGKAAGYIPNFASDKLVEKYTAISLGATSSVRPMMSKGTIGGKKFVMNNQEVEFPGVGKNGDSMVIPLYGDGPRIAAKGFIPNFATVPSVRPYIDYAKSLDLKVGNPGSTAYKEVVRIANRTEGGKLRSEEEIKKDINQLAAARKGTVGSVNALKGVGKFAYMYAAQGKQDSYKGRVALTKDSKPVPFNFSTVGLRRPYTFEDDINEKITPVLDDLAAKVIPEGSKLLKVGKSDFNEFIDKSAFNQLYGRLFEAVINRAIGKSVKGETGTQRFEFFQPDLSGQYSKALNDIFSSSNLSSFAAGDLKFKAPSPQSASVLSFVKKMAAQSGVPYDKTARIAAQGFIPNFASAVLSAKKTENRTNGYSGAQLVKDSPIGPFVKTPGQSSNLNTLIRQDHPEGLGAAIQNSAINQGFSKGFIPNFAIGDSDVQGADAASALTALGTQATAVGFAFQFSKNEYDEALKKITTLGDGTQRTAKGFDKFNARLQSSGLALSIAAPILGETIKNIVGQETKGGRVGGSLASAAGQIGSFAGTGALIAGPAAPLGAGIGAAVGALLTIPDVVKNALTDFPELAKEAKKAQEQLTAFGDASSRLIQAYESYKTVLESGNASAEQLSKAQKSLADSLLSVPAEYREELTAAVGTGRVAETAARIQEINAQEVVVKAGIANLEQISGEAAYQDFINPVFDALYSAISPVQMFSDKLLEITTGKGFSERLFGSSQETLASEANVENINDIFEKALINGDFSIENLESLKNIEIDSSSVENLKKSLQSIGQTNDQGEFKPDFTEKQINAILKQAEIDLSTTANNVSNAFNGTVTNLEDVINKNLEAQDRLKAYNAALDESRKRIDATVSSLQTNIAIENLRKAAIENLSNDLRGFLNTLQIERDFGQPRETLENIIGADKTPVRRLAAQEGLAGIQEQQRAATATAGINFKEEIRGILQKPFEENAKKLLDGLNSQALKGEPSKIETQTDEIINKTTTEYQNLDSTMKNVEGLMSQFVSGQISTQQLLEQSRNVLSGVGIDVSRGSQASDQIEKAVTQLQIKSVQEQIKAFQQRAKLANETKQAILQSRIDAALGAFGGFEGFLNRPEEDGNYIQRIAPDLTRIQELRESPTFRYNNKDAIQEQEKQAPDLGRAFAKVYKELITQSGGAFRDFLQQTIDQGLQQTGVEGRSGLAGAGVAGGFDDIVRGRQQDLEQQLKLAEDQIKVTTDPVLKRDLQGFVDSVRNLPGGTKGIAQLQTQKELGVARQGDFAQLYGKYENEALNRLKDISPELAASLESAISLSDDPLVAEAQLQSQLQGEMIGYLGPIQSAILQIANSGAGGGSVIGTGVPQMAIEAYQPKLTEEQQKKAAEIKKQQEKEAKKQADIKAQKAQEAAIPKDNRTSAEIEAETRAKRDQKYFQAQLSPKNRSTGERFKSIEEVDAEMNKALALSAVNPDQKAYYNVLKNFKEKLDPTGGRKERSEMFMAYEKEMTFDPNSPSEIEKRAITARDQRLAGIQNPQQILGPNLSLGPSIPLGEENLQSQIQSEIKPLSELGTSLRPLSDISNDVNRASYDMGVKRKGLYEGAFGQEVERRKLEQNPLLTLQPQNITTQGGQAIPVSEQLNQQSFTQQEAAFNSNTSAITTLASSIENLNSTITQTQSATNNLNNPNIQSAGASSPAAQPQVSANTNAPVSVIVNAPAGVDIATAVGQAVQNAIPTIVERVRIAMGEKVPPTVSRPPLTTNPQFGAGQRADGGFLL